MNLLEHAVRAVQRGFWIFPLPPGKKHNPRLRWSEVATNDLAKVVDWWSRCPEANIGVACKQSQLLVVDCDVPKKGGLCKGTPYEFLHEKHGPDVDGHDVLRAVCERYGGDFRQLEDTYRVCTTRMGLHLYYRWPAHVVASQASLVPGLLDVRTNGGTRGGYVLAAGSWTEAGAYVAENDSAVAPTPAWLVELVRDKPRPTPPTPHGVDMSSRSANFSGLAATVGTAPEGNRNNALLWAARAMVSDGAQQHEIEETLGPAARANGLTEREIQATIRSARRLQSQKEG